MSTTSDSRTAVVTGLALAAGAAGLFAITQRSKAAALAAKTAALEAEIATLKVSMGHTNHWNPKFGERRGLGDAVVKVNHIAIIVSDVGRSAAWYSDVLGLQQVRRPNFDRHGAWFTMGNCELHLIKGNPVVASGDDLIVSHTSLEIDPEYIESGAVAKRLTELGVHWRQNISVPDPKKSRESKFEDTNDQAAGAKASPTTGVVQYFIRDPDGYYIEICNCDRLTAFCLGEDDAPQKHLEDYHEGHHGADVGLAVVRMSMRWKLKGKKHAVSDEEHIMHHDIVAAKEADPEKLQNLLRRRNTYGDVTQGHVEEEIVAALKEANNDVGIALELIKAAGAEHQMFQPPAWIEDGVITKGPAFKHSASSKRMGERSSTQKLDA